MDHVLAVADLRPGERLLDVGSNTCWASNIFARRGLEVIALDIATAELQGLRTADYFLETGEVYFERLLSVMFEPAVASETMDYVFCCEVLHHNDPEHLRRTLRECFRVLRPGGRLFVVNEPLRFLAHPKLRHAAEVADFEGNEHVYFLHRYVLAARAAGFRIAPPWLRGVADDARRWPDAHRLAGLERALRRRPGGRAVIDAKRIARYVWRHVLAGDRSLFLDCTKPGRHASQLFAHSTCRRARRRLRRRAVDARRRPAVASAAAPFVACRRIGRWAWRHVIFGDRSLFLDCRKPPRA